MIFKPLTKRDLSLITEIGYGNAFRYNNRLYLLCTTSQDVPLKEDDYLFGMDIGGQIHKFSKKAYVESVPVVLLECNSWDEANGYLD